VTNGNETGTGIRRHRGHAAGRGARAFRGVRRLASGLVAAGLLAACPAPNGNPCSTKACADGLVCVATLGEARCEPPVDPCVVAGCTAAQRCHVGSNGRAVCSEPDLCLGVGCPDGKGCDPATGECSRDVSRCLGVLCAPGETCDPATGACAAVTNLCAGVCCPTDFVCDPSTGSCAADLCADSAVSCKCGPAQVCQPLTGACLDVPGPCGICEASQFCDRRTGRCVTIEQGRPEAGKVGAPCTGNSDCGLSGADAFCIADGGLFGALPGGACSASCDQVACPSGAGCVDFGIGDICLDLCLGSTDCRDGFECLAVMANDARRFCFPRGARGSTCTGPECRPVGSDCARDQDCIRGATCRLGMAGGYCIMENCRNTDCDDARESCWCLGTGDCAGSTIAVGKCDLLAQNCRAGYTCYPLRATGTDGYCFSRGCEDDLDCRTAGDACDQQYCDAALGRCDDACRTSADCRGGRTCDTSTGRCYTACRLATDNCGPDGICDTNLASATARRCVRRCVNSASCEDHEFCDLLSGRCTPKCQRDQDCPSGLLCGREGRCRAGCAEDAACGGGEYCESGRCVPKCGGNSSCAFGQVCETASGRCRRDLTQALVGGTCVRDGDCGIYHATCLTGAPYPGGYCTATACSAEEPCGAGAVCAEEGERIVCLKSCRPTVREDCRAGYTCEARGNGNACVPAP
jgi:hypothetical protein